MNSIKSLFLLDPSVLFFNHGSFGATPRPVFDEYQHWQRELECQPVKFLGRDINACMASARQVLASYVGAEAQDVVYFPNPTTAANVVARSLPLLPGDEILTTDHEYGAMDRTWRFICRKTGAKYIQHPIPLPLTTREDFVDRFWHGVTERTRVIFISHITSATALIFPVEEICQRARQAGILTIIDGAHAPGQIPVNLASFDPDVYLAACHKWMMAPKGSAFLYVRRDLQPQIEPLVVSWGYEEATYVTGHPFINHHEWQGTRDMSAFLATPAAIRFRADHDWETISARSRAWAAGTRARIDTLTGLPSIAPDGAGWFGQFFAARLPAQTDVEKLKTQLYEESRIEIPVYRWNDQPLIRVSVQGYNTPEELDTLLIALEKLL